MEKINKMLSFIDRTYHFNFKKFSGVDWNFIWEGSLKTVN